MELGIGGEVLVFLMWGSRSLSAIAESSTMLGSRGRTGNASCPLNPQKKSHRTALVAFIAKDSNVVDAAIATADTTPWE